MIDYQDFLRIKGFSEWHKSHPYAECLGYLNRNLPTCYKTFQKGIENPDPEICVNVLIGLIIVATYLLYRQINHLEADFLKNGGLRQKMTRARLASRTEQRKK